MQAKIDLKVGEKGGRSYIRSLYTTPPFRMIPVGALRQDGGCYLMQTTTSPGVLSGDRYELLLEVDNNARLTLLSQSYQRLFDMEGSAEQRMRITIGEHAHFSQVSHPIVPHKNSSYSSHTTVEMGEGSTFLQSEIITCGRKYHGEEFVFRDLSTYVEVRSRGVLRLRDRVWLTPQRSPLRECGLLEGYTHQGTLIYQSTMDGDIKPTIEDIYNLLSKVEGLRFGISATHYSGFVIRALGDGGESLYNTFCEVQERLAITT